MLFKKGEFEIKSGADTLELHGKMRLQNEDYTEVRKSMTDFAAGVAATLTIDLRPLKLINSGGIACLSSFISDSGKPPGEILLHGNGSLPWQEKTLKNLKKLWEIETRLD